MKDNLIKYLGVGLGSALLLYLILKPRLAKAEYPPAYAPYPRYGYGPSPTPTPAPAPTYPVPPEAYKWGFFSELARSIPEMFKAFTGKTRPELEAESTPASFTTTPTTPLVTLAGVTLKETSPEPETEKLYL